MQHDDGSTLSEERCTDGGHGECADGGERDCNERGTSDCRREGGRGRGNGNCRRGHGTNEAETPAATGAATGALTPSATRLATPSPSAGARRIAVCASGPSLGDRVHERFGRAECFQLIDLATMTTRVIGNDDNRAGSEGAGIGAVELIAEHGAQVAIVTKVGPKAADAFRRAGIPVYEGTGLTVSDAVAAYLRGELTCLDQA